MDFELTAEQREIQALAREFAKAEIEPNAADWDREHRFPPEIFPKLAELGLMGVCVPEEYGGAGADFVSYILVLEELSRADAGVGVTVAVHTSAVDAADPRVRHRRAARRASCRRSRAGEQIGAFALTEPEAGSDAGSLRTAATPENGGWRDRGDEAVHHDRAARRDLPALRAHRPVDSQGRRRLRVRPRRGARHGHARRGEARAQLLDHERHRRRRTSSDGDRLLHQEGKGFQVAMATLDGGRIGIAAQAVGIARAAYEASLAYARERRQFGKPIAEQQAIQHKLADMSTEIDAARLLVLRAAWLKEQGRPHAEEGAKAKLFASEVARRQTAEAIQIFGGYGYTKEFPVERYYRDAKITEIYEGTSEIQRLVIARSILGLKQRQLASG